MVEHKDLTGAALHEPKGCASASAGKVYVADGSGSGAWKKFYVCGWEDYNDLTTATTPITLTTADTYYTITNDGAGAYSSSTYKIPNRTTCWNTTSNSFDFGTAGFNISDTVELRIDLVITTTDVNVEIEPEILFADGSGNSFSLSFGATFYKATGTHSFVKTTTFYIGNQYMLDYPAKLRIKSSNSGDTVKVNGFYIKTTPINLVAV